MYSRYLNFIDRNGECNSEWVSLVEGRNKEGYCIVQNVLGNRNIINPMGKLVSKVWFYDVYAFQNGFAIVKRRDQLLNYLTTEGKLLSEEWFKMAYNFKDGIANVQKQDGTWYYMDTKGELHERIK